MRQAVRVRPIFLPQRPITREILKGDSGPLYLHFVPGEITGKELDTETGYYYFGARYLDPKTSRWISVDPAMGEYVPSAPVNDEAKKRNGNLPGQGGVFNYVNLHVYAYTHNNPVKYIDPNGELPVLPLVLLAISIAALMQSDTQQSQPQSMTVGRSLRIDTKLENTPYSDGQTSTMRATGSKDNTGRIILETNLGSRASSSMLRGGLNPENYNDGRTSTKGTIMGTLDLGDGTIANFMSESESGSHYSDVKLNYSKGADGKLIDWNITVTGINPMGTAPQDRILSKPGALKYLDQNRAVLIETGKYNEIEKLFD